MPADFSKPYDAKAVEKELYERWEASGYFNPEHLPGERQEPFTIMMPPPNATGILHAGHALFLTVQDLIIRFQRMRGKKALWLPGTDHAAIATQARVEKDIYKEEGKSRYDLGRDEMLRRINEFVEKHRGIMVAQMRAMGSSCDWSREAFTLDDARNRAVNVAFKQLYDLGLIYRGARIVNWDPKMQTTVSDDEIEWKEETVPFYYFQYGPFVIGTSRPETKFGDKYVVMHPDDERYSAYHHGQTFDLEWINGPVKATVIKDPAIDVTFGTGVMTITPWHDTADFEIAGRHKEIKGEQVIDFNGKLLPIAGEFAGLHINKARPLVVEKLKAKGLLVKTEEGYVHRVATNSRGGGVIEPQIKEQWWIDVNKEFVLPKSEIDGIAAGATTTLKKIMRHVVESGQINIIPDHYKKIYFHWIDNLRDWCISRQIWYGHRIPVWYKGNELAVGEAPEGSGWEQDSDTLDTWFSSGLWTFSTLGWPDDTKDLHTYHPTDVLETAYEILFFWVARMILMTTSLVGQVPFKNVYLHGLVRDERRKKLSKSNADSADPLDLIEKFGTDALRFALVFGTAPGTDSILSEDKIKGMKHFANKIWNAARFVTMNLDAGTNIDEITTPDSLTSDDKLILDALKDVAAEATRLLDEYKFYLAADQLYHYFWHTFADKIIEDQKPRLQNPAERAAAQYVLAQILVTNLKLLHPFMPFVTEAVWQALPMKEKTLLLVETWPA